MSRGNNTSLCCSVYGSYRRTLRISDSSFTFCILSSSSCMELLHLLEQLRLCSLSCFAVAIFKLYMLWIVLPELQCVSYVLLYSVVSLVSLILCIISWSARWWVCQNAPWERQLAVQSRCRVQVLLRKSGAFICGIDFSECCFALVACLFLFITICPRLLYGLVLDAD